jgi:hypothetical protein
MMRKNMEMFTDTLEINPNSAHKEKGESGVKMYPNKRLQDEGDRDLITSFPKVHYEN